MRVLSLVSAVDDDAESYAESAFAYAAQKAHQPAVGIVPGVFPLFRLE